MIGELAAAAGHVDGKTCLDEVFRLGRGAGGIERRVFEEPDLLAGGAGGDLGDARLHMGEGVQIGDRPVVDTPMDGPAAGRQRKTENEIVAHVNHPFTIAW